MKYEIEMARIGVTYLEVAQAADSLVARGELPTLRKLRIELGGTGSPNTIQKHLSVWREARPVPVSAVTQLSETLLRAISAEIFQAEAKSKSQVEIELIETRSVVADLAEMGNTLEIEVEQLRSELLEAVAQRDQVTAVNAKLLDDAASMQEKLEREQAAAESARIEAAMARLKGEAQTQRLSELEAQIQKLNSSLDHETENRITSERQLAVESTKLGAVERENKSLSNQVAGLALKISELNDAAGQVLIQHKEELVELRSALDLERVAHNQARVEAATALGKLDSIALLKSENEALKKQMEEKKHGDEKKVDTSCG